MDERPLASVRYRVGDLPRETISAPNYDDAAWDVLPDTRSWGTEPEITTWLRTSFTVPADWSDGTIEVHVESQDCETIVYVDGKPASSLDTHNHFDVTVADRAAPGATHSIVFEAYSGLGRLSAYPRHTGVMPRDGEHRFKAAEYRLIDPAVRAYSIDIEFAYEALRTIDKNAREYGLILDAIEKSINILDFRGVGSDQRFRSSVDEAAKCLRSELYDRHGAGDLAPIEWACGNSHIDTAWLWRIAHTRKKCQRTFLTQMDLIDRYPDFIFSCSQPQQYQYVKEDYPELYERIKSAVKSGNWVPVGGMWIEPDCNIAGGESLVRQLLYGVRYTQSELGFRSRVLWLPDVFGYSAALPQIIRKAGMTYFMTIKIFCNRINRPPYQTFNWEGIDGSRVFTHYCPLGVYNEKISPSLLRRNWDSYDQKQLTDSCLFLYGYGDGGGGPTSGMLEYARRAKDFPGLPKVKLASPEDFFDDLARQTEGKSNVPSWRGEIYLELHRGTYTSQGKYKRLNRQAEYQLLAAEQVSSLCHALGLGVYPAKPIEHAWKLVLLNQFHDIIPGSSITEVYQDAKRDYDEAAQIGNGAIDNGLSELAAHIDAPDGAVAAYNPLSWPRQDVAEVSASTGMTGQAATSIDGLPVTVVDLRDSLPSVGYAVYSAPDVVESGDLAASTKRLENRFFAIDLDGNGEIASLTDKRTGRQVIDETSYCKGNALLSFEDKPMKNDAWDIDIYYEDKTYPITDLASIEVVERGPIRAAVELVRRVDGRGSTIKQRICIYRDLPRIDFVTLADWHEQERLLKAAFPVTVNASQATYDIQFGNVERPTHWNTSWDWARFEVCGHKWADLSEGNYGVSLLSDSKYGWDIKGNVMRLTLIKSPIYPDPLADKGEHRFTYSLMPHPGSWREAETVRRAYELNVPVHFAKVTKGSGSLPREMSFVSVDSPNLIVETVKKAEDDGDIIVRVHDEYNQRGIGRLTFARPVKAARSVNLIEDEPDGTDPAVDGADLVFSYGPYEIRTFKIAFR